MMKRKRIIKRRKRLQGRIVRLAETGASQFLAGKAVAKV
jgi:hypothetical protein